MNVTFVTLPETYLSKLRGVNQTCIVFCPNNVDSLPEFMSTNCPNWGGGRQLPPLTPHTIRLWVHKRSTVIHVLSVYLYMHADDTQVYIELSQSDTHKSISSLSDCLTDISLWMKSSKLKLNSDKTEFIIIGTKQQRHKLSTHFPVKLLDNDIPI